MHVTEYYSTLKNDEMVPFTMTWTDLESVVLSETSQAEKDENHTMSLIELIKRKKEPRKSVTFNPWSMMKLKTCLCLASPPEILVRLDWNGFQTLATFCKAPRAC